MSRIVVSGYYGSKNAGDEAMLVAMIEVLSDLDPQLNITVISANPEDTKSRHGVDAVSWLDIPAILKALHSADLLISGGGSLLQNVTSRRSLYYYLGIISMARLLGRPVMLYAQGIGPIYGSFARKVMNWIGNHVNMITVRDKGSLEELSDLGINRPHIECTADPVLGIHRVGTERGREILKEFNADGAKPAVGLAVREWRGWKRYKEVLAKCVDRIVRELDARVVFLPMQYPEDVRAAESIAALAEEPCTVLPEEYTTAELMSLVGNMDLMLCIRLHALIFAGVMEVPMVGISYDPKIDRYLSSIGELPAGELSSITEDSLMVALKRRWEERKTVSRRNPQLMGELRRLASRNAELALELAQRHKLR